MTKKKALCLLLIIVLSFANFHSMFANNTSGKTQIKNIIYMIPDGGAMTPFYLADYVKQAGGLTDTFPNATPVETGEMYIKQYLVGAEYTRSASSIVTDSAASGTALSSGYRTNNKMVGITPEKTPRANILEACQELGKKTGIVVTYEFSNATPAAFSSHAESRYDTLEIAEQVVNQGIDVVFGNTLEEYEDQDWFQDENFEKLGYDVIKSKEQLNAIKAGDRVWGKLPSPSFDIQREASTPNLAELTKAALTALDDGSEEGFFLMVEGSAVDGGGHRSDALLMVSEYLAFDAACKVAIEFAKKRNDTIVVIMPDHDTGGLTTGNSYARSSLEALVPEIRAGIDPDYIVWEGNKEHTYRYGGIFMYVPKGISYPAGIDKSKAAQLAFDFEEDMKVRPTVNTIDNFQMAPYLAGLIGVDFDASTQRLFVDITDKGTYDSETEIFTFTNDAGSLVSIERNTSFATVDAKKFDLDGQVAVYLNSRFYVPEKLLNATSQDK